MLDAHFSHLYFCQSLHTLQCSLAVIADLLVKNHLRLAKVSQM